MLAVEFFQFYRAVVGGCFCKDRNQHFLDLSISFTLFLLCCEYLTTKCETGNNKQDCVSRLSEHEFL